MTRFVVAVLTVVLAAGSCFGQATTAQISGKVTDPSGAAVPGASITITNTNTPFKRETASNEQGIYSAPLLPPGSYRLNIVKAGFRPVSRTGVQLAVDQSARIDIVLEIGAMAETIDVVASAPLIEQDTSALGQVIDGSKIANIPLNGRSPFRLVQLTTNVLTAPSANGTSGDGPVNTLDDAMISINGGRARTNEVLIDGIPSTTGFSNQITTVPNVDSTQEFKVQSSGLSAEWGRFGGGVINVSTRSGTNQFHGSLFEFLRNDALDANEFFNKRAGRTKPAFRMNQFGYAVGGPVLAPKIYNGKDRTFFFTDFQGMRWRRGDVFIGSVPTAAQRRGDFNGTLTQRGQQMAVYDPVSSRPDPARPGRFVRDPFPGNTVPQNRMDPVALKVLSYYPQPNTAGDPVTQTNNFANNAPRETDQAMAGARLDHNLTAVWRMFGRFALSRTALAQPDNYGNPATTGVGANGKVLLNNYTAGMDHTVTLGPATVVNMRYGFARFFWSRLTRSYGFNQKELGLPDSLVSQLSEPLFPIIAVEGYLGTSGGTVQLTGQDTHSLLGSLTRLSGRHSLKTGLDIRLRRLNRKNLANGGGQYAFTRAMTRGPDPNVVTENAGVGVASLLLGTMSSGVANIAAGYSFQNFYYAGYIQDDIKLSSRMALNIGLRYETESPYTERRDGVNWFDFAMASPVRNSAFPNINGGLVFANPENRAVYSWDRNNIAPRAGFAWTLASRTVFRAGAGVFFAPYGISDDGEGFAPNAGYSSSTPLVATLDGITPYRYFRDPYPEGLAQPTRDALGARTYLGQGIAVLDGGARTPYSVQWNADLQQSFGRDWLVDAAYSANRGVKLNRTREYNALAPQYLELGTGLQALAGNPFYPNITAGALAQPTVQRRQLLLPYPQYTSVGLNNSSSGNSIYHSLALKLEKRATRGAGFLLAYTIGKLISDVRNSQGTNGNNQNVGLNTSVQNWYDLRSERSVAEVDAAQSLILSGVAELPFGQGQRFLAGARGLGAGLVSGWQVSGVFLTRSGFPLVTSATIPGGGNRPNSTGQSANLGGGRPRGEQVGRWFDTGAFTQPASFTFGNVSRTLPDVRGPGLVNWDMSLVKNTALRENVQLQFRAESFNLLNRPNFWQPNTALNSQQFGQLNLTTGFPRVNQLALKLIF